MHALTELVIAVYRLLSLFSFSFRVSVTVCLCVFVIKNEVTCLYLASVSLPPLCGRQAVGPEGWQLVSHYVAVRQLGQKGGNWSEEKNERLVQRMDTDGNGQIDRSQPPTTASITATKHCLHYSHQTQPPLHPTNTASMLTSLVTDKHDPRRCVYMSYCVLRDTNLIRVRNFSPFMPLCGHLTACAYISPPICVAVTSSVDTLMKPFPRTTEPFRLCLPSSPQWQSTAVIARREIEPQGRKSSAPTRQLLLPKTCIRPT